MEFLVDMAVWLFRVLFRQSTARTAAASFAFAILVGTVLLTLPAGSRQGRWTAPVDALFTATSAVCVTGLIVKSTPQHWSHFGQVVILTLIQMGGLGIMTVSASVAIMLPRRLMRRFEAVVGDLVEAGPLESVWTLIGFICLFAFVAEAAGTAVLFVAWRANFPDAGQCLYHSVFHAISAFCNAGFSLNDNNLEAYVDSISVNAVVCTLIVIGGLGFTVVRDLVHYGHWWLLVRRGKKPRLSTHTKLVLTVTGVLLLVGFVGILVIESHASLSEAPWKTRLLASMFQSVTPRTAGFNTIRMDPKVLAPATTLLLMALMYVGGSPGGTAGGIKTSTLGVMIASIIAILKGRSRAELFHHSVPEAVVHRVLSIILLSLSALAGAVFLLLMTESASLQRGVITVQEVAFDAVSAFGTVGLSLGLATPDGPVTTAGKLILTALMFVGRLGPITLALSIAWARERAAYQYPEEQVLVG